MGYKHLDSFKELIIMREKMGRFFEREEASAQSLVGSWAPAVDLYETEESIILLLELAGVEEKDVKIDLWENYVTIYGERRFKGREENYLCLERSYGPFQRTFRLPASVEEGNVNAEFKFGVLRISMKKKQEPGHEYVRVTIG